MPPAAPPSPLAALEPRRCWWRLALMTALAFMVGFDFLAVPPPYMITALG